MAAVINDVFVELAPNHVVRLEKTLPVYAASSSEEEQQGLFAFPKRLITFVPGKILKAYFIGTLVLQTGDNVII